MIHYITRNGKEYYIIQTTFEAAGIQAPIQMQINVSGLSEQNKFVIHRNASLFLNRPLRINPPKPQEKQTPPKKVWWKFW
jgi:hypothetical protein